MFCVRKHVMEITSYKLTIELLSIFPKFPGSYHLLPVTLLI